MPSDFEITAELMYTNSSNSYPQIYIGTGLNTNSIGFGQIYQDGRQGFEFKKNNSRLTLQVTTSTATINTWFTIKFTKQGNDYSLQFNNETLTYTNSTVTPTYIFLIYNPSSNSKCRNIKIKAL